MKTNVTVRIEAELAHKAKILAAQRGTSLSQLLARELEQLVTRDQAYEKAMKHALRAMANAPEMGFSNPVSKNELHER
jgi:hypothetical protein